MTTPTARRLRFMIGLSGLVFVLVVTTWTMTRSTSDAEREALPPEPAYDGSEVTSCDRVWGTIHRETLIDAEHLALNLPEAFDPGEPITELPDLPSDDGEPCLAAFETVMVVAGPPGVSGVYKTDRPPLQLRAEENTADGMAYGHGFLGVSGFGASAAELDEDVGRFVDSEPGRCFVGNDGEPFQTKGVTTHFAQIDIEQPDPTDELLTDDAAPAGGLSPVRTGQVHTTIDVGRTFEGNNFMSVDQQLNDGTVTYSYLPEAYQQNQPIIVKSKRTPTDLNEWAGVAAFSSATVNNRDFLPWTDVEYKGSPHYSFQIFVFCG